jgi:hypothetical protein
MFVLNPNPDANWSYLEIQKLLNEDYHHIESDRLDCVNDAWESEYDIFLKIKLKKLFASLLLYQYRSQVKNNGDISYDSCFAPPPQIDMRLLAHFPDC